MKFLCGGSGSTGNAYSLISDDGEILLLDCGIHWKKILTIIDFKPSKVVGCLLTHKHNDHMFECEQLLRSGIPIYTNDETADHYETITGEKMIGKAPNITFAVGEFKVTPFYVPHTTRDNETRQIIPCPNYGYLIDHPEVKMLYATDFEYIPYSFKAQRLNAMILECNHMDILGDDNSGKYEHVLKGHASISTTKRIVEVNRTPMLQNVILCHLSAENANVEVMVEEIKKVARKRCQVDVARPGLQVGLSKYPF